MADLARLVPKQQQLTDHETPTSFESWRESMCFTISLDKKFARFLDDLKTWSSTNVVNRGFTDDDADGGNAVHLDIRMTGVQKATALERVLGIVAGYAPVISHSYVTKTAKSLDEVFNRLRSYYGFRRTGSQITELMDIQLGPNESREALWERYFSFGRGISVL